MKKFFVLLLTILILTASVGCQQQLAATTTPEKQSPIELHIAAAASLTDVMQELAAVYAQEHPEVTITFNFGSSGALQQAIENGGQTDLFFSAAAKQMNALEKSGNLLAGTRKDLLENSLVLIVPQNSRLELNSFTDLSRPELKHIAIGDPSSVPVGQYTEEVLTNLGIFDNIAAKAVYGYDVRQVLAWVATGDADCGIVYATDAASTPQVKIVAAAPAGTHQPIIYPAAVLRDTKHPEEATAFLAFAASEKARAIFTKYGFICK